MYWLQTRVFGWVNISLGVSLQAQAQLSKMACTKAKPPLDFHVPPRSNHPNPTMTQVPTLGEFKLPVINNEPMVSRKQ